MDIADATEFLRTHHRGILHTYRADGSPQMSPVVHALDADGWVTISSRETAMKVRNLRRRPQAELCALADEFFGGWIQVGGAVEIVSMPDALAPLKDNYRAVSGEHPDWDEFGAAMVRDRRVLVRLRIERAGPDRAG